MSKKDKIKDSEVKRGSKDEEVKRRASKDKVKEMKEQAKLEKRGTLIKVSTSDEVVEAIRKRKSFRIENLEVLNLTNCNLRAPHVEQLCIGMQGAGIKAMHLAGNPFGDSGVKAISTILKENSALTELNIGDCGWTIEGALFLAEGLAHNPALTSLTVAGNLLGPDGAVKIANSVSNHKTLKTLHLFGNDIQDIGASMMAAMLEVNTSLTTLILYYNEIGFYGAKKLADSLKKNSTLTSLDLFRNSVGDEGALHLASMLQTNKTLLEINLGWNKISDDGCLKLADALKSNSTLKSLNLRQNVIRDGGATEIIEALKTNKTIAELDIDCTFEFLLFLVLVTPQLVEKVLTLVANNNIASRPAALSASAPPTSVSTASVTTSSSSSVPVPTIAELKTAREARKKESPSISFRLVTPPGFPNPPELPAGNPPTKPDELQIYQRKKQMRELWDKAVVEYNQKQTEKDEDGMKTVLQNLITQLRQDKQPLTAKLSKIFALLQLFTSVTPNPDYEMIASLVASKTESIQTFRKLQRKDLAVETRVVPYIKEVIDFVNFLNFFVLEKTARELDLLRQGIGLVATKEDYENLFKMYDEHRRHLNMALVLVGQGLAMNCNENDIYRVKDVLRADQDYYRMEAEMQGIKL